MDNVIDGRMMMVASTAGSTAQAMSSQCSNLSTTTSTQVWDTNGSAKSQANRDPQGFIVQSQACEELGTASSQAPESLLITAWSLACSTSSAALSRREDAVVSELMPSQFSPCTHLDLEEVMCCDHETT